MSIRLIFLLPLLLGLSGCFPSSPPAHFYMLQPTAIQALPAPPVGARALTIGLGPVRIPAYLDRPQIVTALSGQEYKLADDQRWAERLDNTITRVLAEDLSNLLPAERVVAYPWQSQQKLDAQISVNIQEFHADSTGQVILNAQWALKSPDSGPSQRKFFCSEPASTTDYARIAAAQSVCLGRLGRDMADAVNALPTSALMLK